MLLRVIPGTVPTYVRTGTMEEAIFLQTDSTFSLVGDAIVQLSAGWKTGRRH